MYERGTAVEKYICKNRSPDATTSIGKVGACGTLHINDLPVETFLFLKLYHGFFVYCAGNAFSFAICDFF